MIYRKVAGPMRIDTGNAGAGATIRLPARSGGRNCKVVMYDIVVRASSGDNVRLTLEVWHGPSSATTRLHSTAVNLGQPGTVLPACIGGQADTSLVISEVIEPRIKIRDSALTTAQWAVVEVYEMRKPF